MRFTDTILDNQNGCVMVFNMKTITLKEIPPPLHTALKARARQNGRSLNKEAIACLENAVTPHPVNVDALLAEIRAHRITLPGSLTDQHLAAADDGRP